MVNLPTKQTCRMIDKKALVAPVLVASDLLLVACARRCRCCCCWWWCCCASQCSQFMSYIAIWQSQSFVWSLLSITLLLYCNFHTTTIVISINSCFATRNINDTCYAMLWCVVCHRRLISLSMPSSATTTWLLYWLFASFTASLSFFLYDFVSIYSNWWYTLI